MASLSRLDRVRLQQFLDRLSESSPGDFSSHVPAPEILRDWSQKIGSLGSQEDHDRLQRENELLRDVSNRLALGLDTEQLSERIMDALGALVRHDAAGLYLVRNGRIIWETLRGYDTENMHLVKSKLDRGLMAWSGMQRCSVRLGDVLDDGRYLNVRNQTRSELVVPILLEGQLMGFFNLEADQVEAFSPDDQYLVEVFAGQVALAIERSNLLQERMQRRQADQEMEVARSIQRDHFPEDNLSIGDLHIAGTYLTNKQVGGDYYDFFRLDMHRVLVTIADVTGKGVPAALIMTSVRTGVHLLTDQDSDLPGMVKRLNRYLSEITETNVFVTLFCGIYDTRDASFTFVNAGHNPPLVLQQDGSTRMLVDGGLLLGSFPGVSYEQGQTTIAPGESVLFYTDGISEALDAKEEEYGDARLLKSFQRHGGKEPARLLMCLLNDLQDFVGNSALASQTGDDLTLVVMHRARKEEA